MATTRHTLEQFIAQQEVHDALVRDGALTVTEIALRIGVPESVAQEAVYLGLEAGYLERDEFGKYAPWCAWPRIGL